MKYLAIMLFSAAAGFFAGYLLTRDLGGSVSSVPPKPPQTVYIEREVAAGREAPAPLVYAELETLHTVFDQLLYAHQLAAQSSVAELESHLLSTAASLDPLFNYNIASIFLEKYTAIDPLAAIRFIENHPSFDKHRFIIHIVTSWVRQDPDAAIDYYQSLRDQQLKNLLGSRLLADPTLSPTGLVEDVVAALGPNSDRLVALARSNQLSPGEAFSEALQQAGPNRQAMAQRAVMRWIRQDPTAALNAISQLENLRDQQVLLQVAVNQYAQSDPEAALAYARNIESSSTNLEQQVLGLLARQDPVNALPLVEDFISRTGNLGPLNALLSNWARTSPEDAIAYAQGLEDNQRNSSLQTIAYNYVNARPEEGFNWLLGLPAAHKDMVNNVIGGLVNQNTAAVAEAAIAQVTDSNLRVKLITNVARHKAATNPEAALAWISGFERDAGYEAGVQNVLQTWSHQNPRAAANAIEDYLNESFAQPIVSQIASNWYRASQDDAVNWVRSLEDGAVKYQALSNLTGMIAHTDPDAAIDLIGLIPEGQHADSAKRTLAFAWTSREPENVDTIIRSLELSEGDAKQIRQLSQRRLKP